MYRLVPLGIASLLLAGCGGLPVCDQPRPYHAARPGPAIQSPEGMAEIDQNPAWEIPGEKEYLSANPDYHGGGCLAVPPEVVKRPLDEEGELIEPEETEEEDDSWWW